MGRNVKRGMQPSQKEQKAMTLSRRGKSTEEIAKALGTSTGGVERLLHDADVKKRGGKKKKRREGR